jgi:hypothetical protein
MLKKLPESERSALLHQKQADERVEKLALQLQQTIFPEEYDLVGDSMHDAKLRKQGVNPMSKDYSQRINEKRILLGVSPLSPAGLRVDNSSIIFCRERVKEAISAVPNEAMDSGFDELLLANIQSNLKL